MARTKPVIGLLLLVFVSIVLVSCGKPKPLLRTQEYHEPKPDKEVQRSLNSLQLKSLQFMNEGRFEDAIHYLQRAIKVEPRNALNWHYLAQNYWHLQDFKTCRSMIKRSRSYAELDDDLDRANQALQLQCSPL